MAKLGFLGLGTMGYPMARNLLRAGHDVALWSHTAAKAKELAAAEKGKVREYTQRGGSSMPNASFSAWVIRPWPSTSSLDRRASSRAPGRDSLSLTQALFRPAAAARSAQNWRKKSIHYMDVPCTGSTPGANAGTLTFMVGGDQAILDKIRPWMEPMGKRIFYCGGPGLGLQAKLSQNLILSNILQAFNEGMVLATKGGVDPNLMLEVLTIAPPSPDLSISKPLCL